MDPKTPANLDPKLKEVYERVMGTPTAPSSAINQEPPAPSQLPQEQEPSSQNIQSAPAETVPVAQNVPAEKPHEEPAHPFPKNSFVANQTKTTSNLMPLIIAGLLIFFTAYTIFWLKFFNINLIPLPF